MNLGFQEPELFIQFFDSLNSVGKDAAGIAMEAIKFARESGVDVVLVDTAGRMQDNEPLMKALSKVRFSACFPIHAFLYWATIVTVTVIFSFS